MKVIIHERESFKTSRNTEITTNDPIETLKIERLKSSPITYEEINMTVGKEMANEFFIPMYLVNIQTLNEDVLREVLERCRQFENDIAILVNKKEIK